MDKIKSLKVKQADGTLGPAIALGADAANVDMADGSTVEAAMANKQATLVSGTNIKTINNNSILGSGNINLVTDLSNYYNKTEVNDLISNLSSLDLQVVTTLPTSNISSSTIYLIAREDGDAQNIYEEYIYINNTWEMIGTTEVDTSTFDEVYVGSDTPTSESVEIWINPDGTADEGSTDAYTKAETDAKITEATKYVDNIVKVDKNASNIEQQAALKYIVDSILADPNQAPIVSVVGQEDEPNMFFAYTHHNTAGTEFYFQGSLTHAYTSTNPGQGERVVFEKQGMSITVSSGSYTCVQTENQLYSGYYLPTDQTYASFTPTHDNHPANKKYVDGYSYSKAEIDAKFAALASQYVKQVNGTTTALWMGTQEQYDAIATKDATTTYIIQGTIE